MGINIDNTSTNLHLHNNDIEIINESNFNLNKEFLTKNNLIEMLKILEYNNEILIKNSFWETFRKTNREVSLKISIFKIFESLIFANQFNFKKNLNLTKLKINLFENQYSISIQNLQKNVYSINLYLEKFYEGVRDITLLENNFLYKELLKDWKKSVKKLRNIFDFDFEKIFNKNKPTHNFDSKQIKKYFELLMDKGGIEDFNINPDLPIILVPCAGEKPIQESKSHRQFFHKLKKYGNLFILSEPLTIIPYNYPKKSTPVYDYPPKELNKSGEDKIFINNLANFIKKFFKNLKVYYLLPEHHFKILNSAWKKSGSSEKKLHGYIYERPELNIFSRYLIRDLSKDYKNWEPNKSRVDNTDFINHSKEIIKNLEKMKFHTDLIDLTLKPSIFYSKKLPINRIIQEKGLKDYYNLVEISNRDGIKVNEISVINHLNTNSSNKVNKLDLFTYGSVLGSFLDKLSVNSPVSGYNYFFLQSKDFRLLKKSYEIFNWNLALLKGNLITNNYKNNELEKLVEKYCQLQ